MKIWKLLFIKMKLLCQNNILQLVNNSKIRTRPNAGPGLWLMFLLPLALIISVATQPIISTSTYKLSSIFSLGIICSSLVFLYQSSKTKRLRFFDTWQIIASSIIALLFQVCLHRGILFSIWSAISSTILYHHLYLFILEKMPLCFTLGEAAICTQSYILLLYFTSINIFSNITKTATNVMQMSTLTIQMGLLGIVIIALSVHQFNITSPSKFYTVVIFVFIFVVLLPLQILLKSSPLLWIIDLLWDDLQTNKVVLCWTFCSVLAVLVVSNRTKEAKKSSSAVRKVFHILTVSVFIPGLLYNCSLLYLASGIILGIFFVLEILRVTNIPPLAYHLQNGFVVFSDEKDSGIIAFTPMYLLAGCALPLWIHPAPCDVTNSAIFSLLPLLSGVLTTGIGDTAASIVGSKFGYHQWHGSKKTIEGTIACVVSQLLVIFILVHLEFLKFHSTMLYVKVIMAITVTSLIEAKTDQIDNLVLPLVMYIILIV